MFRDNQEVWLGRGCLLLLLGLFVLLRLPALLHQAGGQDEQFFSIPGWTVYREGVPRIPYLPSRNRATFFENARPMLDGVATGLVLCPSPFLLRCCQPVIPLRACQVSWARWV